MARPYARILGAHLAGTSGNPLKDKRIGQETLEKKRFLIAR
jgi:hypothetical protein